MEFDWDEAKRKANLQNHGIDFVCIQAVFEGETVTILDDRFDYGEQRFVTFGILEGRVVAVVHTETEELIRIISVGKRREMEKRLTTKRSATDWKRVDALKDKDIDKTEVPEVSPEMFARGLVRKGLKPAARKKQLTIRVDGDVLDWYKRQGQGYQTKINSLLRAYMDAHKA